MASLDNCFVDEVKHPVQWIEVGVPTSSTPGNGQQPARSFRKAALSTLEDLTPYVENGRNNEYTCQFISICQHNSWKPLQSTKQMIDLIVAEYDITSSFWDLISCFYMRSMEVESAFCVPYTEFRKGSIVEILYTLRYPEYKTSDERWVIRQSGVYHRFNAETHQSLFILLGPIPNSKGHQKAEEWLRSYHGDSEREPFWLHNILASVYFPAWRQYIAALEREFLPIGNSTFSTYIEEPLRVGYSNLNTLVSIDNRFLQTTTLLESTTEVLTEICALMTSVSTRTTEQHGTQQLRNTRRQCIAYSRTATHLHQRAQLTTQLLADTLSFRDQIVAKEQNGNMLKLNQTAVFITTLTLLYLPASFVTSFFGMNFFGMDQDNNRIVGTPMIWIFVVSSIILTAATISLYYWLSLRDGILFRRYTLKLRLPLKWRFNHLAQRLRSGGTNAGIELQNSRV